MSLLSVLCMYQVAMLSMQVVFGAKLVFITAMYKFYVVRWWNYTVYSNVLPGVYVYKYFNQS